MPELPEVEVVRRGLERSLVGRTVTAVEVYHPRAIRRHLPGAADFASRLVGRTVLAAHRRGKYLWLPLGDLPIRAAAVGPGAAPAGLAGPGVAPGGPAGLGVASGGLAGPGAASAELHPRAVAPGAAAGGDSGAAPPDGPPPGRPPADSGEAVLGHLGMSGQLLVVPAGEPAGPHLRARIAFSDGGPELRYVDQRTFGGLSVQPLVEADGARLPAPIRHIARDPLDPAFDEASFTAALRRRRTGVKRALLDQSLISGVGNIYADEALWRARLHWARPTETLSRPAIARLLAAVREVVGEALTAGGTSFDSLYVDVDGGSGYFGRSLAVYGREHEPCPRCGTPIRRDRFMNRSSYTCPRCQPRPRRARW